jgi:hypothetical protein
MIPHSLYEACRFSQRRLRRASRRVRGSCLTSRNETAGRNNWHYATTLLRANAPEAHSPAVVLRLLIGCIKSQLAASPSRASQDKGATMPYIFIEDVEHTEDSARRDGATDTTKRGPCPSEQLRFTVIAAGFFPDANGAVDRLRAEVPARGRPEYQRNVRKLYLASPRDADRELR